MDTLTEHNSSAALYLKHRNKLTQFAAALVGPSDAADVVADAVLSLLKTSHLAEADEPIALMYRAVFAKGRSLQRSLIRRRARERRFADRLVVHDPELRPDVVDAVVGLSSQQRAVVFLTYWEDLTPAEIGERLEIGEGTVKRYLARARARLREVLND